MPSEKPSFLAQTCNARKVLVLDLGFLGDTVHLLPALWAVRQGYPDAQLHVMVAEHVTSLLAVAPWIDRVWGYPRFPKGPKPWQDLGRVRSLRRQKFDVVINFNGSDRSSLHTGLSGARWRLGRRPMDGGPLHWRWLFTHEVSFRHREDPMYVQSWECAKRSGFPGEKPEFHVAIKPEWLLKAGIDAAAFQSYFHVSPCTTQDAKELPLPILAEALNQLSNEFPDKKIVLSCAPNDRERRKLATLISQLKSPPWKTFAGTLNLVELTAVIQQACLHFGGDSGALHLAMMTGVPMISWFREYSGAKDWRPPADEKRVVLVGQETPTGLSGIGHAAIVAAVEKVGCA